MGQAGTVTNSKGWQSSGWFSFILSWRWAVRGICCANWVYGGVDIFFFLMGMGLHYSLQKSEDLRGYASRRLWRILPAYLPILAAWMIVMYPGYQMSTTQTIRSITGNLFMVGFWLQSPSTFNWFVSAQFLFIILAPFCFAFLNRNSKPVLALLMLLGIAGGIGLANIGNEQMMGVSRLPIFILGMAFSMDWPVSRKKGAVRIAYIVLFALGLAMVLLCLTRYKELLIDYGMYWYPFALMTPALCRVPFVGAAQSGKGARGIRTAALARAELV